MLMCPDLRNTLAQARESVATLEAERRALLDGVAAWPVLVEGWWGATTVVQAE